MGRILFAIFLGLSSVLFAEPLCFSGNPRPKTLCAGEQSLQQLRSLMPERLWKEEFRVLINRKAFMQAWHQKKDCIASGHSKGYLLHVTISGENICLLDKYSEFQWSPFW